MLYLILVPTYDAAACKTLEETYCCGGGFFQLDPYCLSSHFANTTCPAGCSQPELTDPLDLTGYFSLSGSSGLSIFGGLPLHFADSAVTVMRNLNYDTFQK